MLGKEGDTWWLDVRFDNNERYRMPLEAVRANLLPITSIASPFDLQHIGRDRAYDRDALRTEIELYGGLWHPSTIKADLAMQLWLLLHPSSRVDHTALAAGNAPREPHLPRPLCPPLLDLPLHILRR